MLKKDLLNNSRNNFAYLIDDVDYTSEENVNYIFKFIKQNVNSEYLMFDYMFLYMKMSFIKKILQNLKK